MSGDLEADLEAEVRRLRTRVAELEATRKPGTDQVTAAILAATPPGTTAAQVAPLADHVTRRAGRLRAGQATLADVVDHGIDPTDDDMKFADGLQRKDGCTRSASRAVESGAVKGFANTLSARLRDGDARAVAAALRDLTAAIQAGEERRQQLADTASGPDDEAADGEVPASHDGQAGAR